MKTIKILLAGLFIFISAGLNAQSYSVDTQKSKVKWLGTKVTGKHYGTISIKSGELGMKNGKIVSGSFVIDMNSIVCEDLEDQEYNQKLVGHLKSDDFFGVETYPEAKLVITKATAFKANKADVNANITIKGKSNPIFFVVEQSGSHYQAKITVDRSKFDVRYGSGSFFENLGDKAISDDFVLDVDLHVIQK
jgi:polyisoprenoid-binding protein YceI